MRPTVVALAGDGIGKVVLPQCLRVLDAVGFPANWVHADIGWECWKREGSALPQRTIDLLAEHRLGLLGAITSKPADQAQGELAPELQGRGHVYRSPIVELRQRFKLEIGLRPCRTLEGNPLNFVRRTRDGGLEEPLIDAVIFRQNTEGLYSGVEWTDPPRDLLRELARHPRFAPFANTPGAELALSVRIFTLGACRRIARAAFEYADREGYASVTVCEKPNVLRETSGMLEGAAREAQRDFPHIRHESTNIDTHMMWLSKNPEDFGVIVCSNMFGDIVSDAYAGLVGGLGFAASANLGPKIGVFEPTHGSAPKYEAFDPPIVNPVAMILAGAMLLDHAGESAKAARVRRAVALVVRRGHPRTFDMLRLPGRPDALSRGAVSTGAMTDAILEVL